MYFTYITELKQKKIAFFMGEFEAFVMFFGSIGFFGLHAMVLPHVYQWMHHGGWHGSFGLNVAALCLILFDSGLLYLAYFALRVQARKDLEARKKQAQFLALHGYDAKTMTESEIISAISIATYGDVGQNR
jgi:hypothetical protein